MGNSRCHGGRLHLGGTCQRQARQEPRQRGGGRGEEGEGGAGTEVQGCEIETEVATTSGFSMATSVEEEAVQARYDHASIQGEPQGVSRTRRT